MNTSEEDLRKAFEAGEDRGRFVMKEGDPNAFHSDYPDFKTWYHTKYASQFKTVEPEKRAELLNEIMDTDQEHGMYETEPCPTCGEVEGMVNPCCANYDSLNYKNCGYG